MNYNTGMRRFALLPLAAVLIAAGPTNTVNRFVGTWKSTASANAQTAEYMKKFAPEHTLQVNADKSFVLNVLGIEMKGTYTLAGNTATFSTRFVAGKEIRSSSSTKSASATIGTLSADGKTLTLSGPGGKGQPVAFTKAGK
jgi:hypothetical protein